MTTNNLPRRPYEVRQAPPRPASKAGCLPWLIRLPLLLTTGVIMLVMVLGIFLALHQLQYEKVIYPGVSAYGIDLSGLSKDNAMAALTERYTYGSSAVFTFRYKDKVWQKTASELGVTFDPTQTIEQAFQVGRGNGLVENLVNQAKAYVDGYAVQPTITFNQSEAEKFLRAIANEVNQPVQDATILVTGAQVQTTPGQAGVEVDVPATLGLVRQTVLNLSTGAEVQLIARETPPAIADADTVAQQVRNVLSGPIQLYVQGNDKLGPWAASQEFMAGLLNITRQDDGNGKAHYELKLALDPLTAFLQTLTPDLTQAPQSARFIFNDTTGQLEKLKDSVSGRGLNIEKTVEAFKQTMLETSGSERKVALVFDETQPTVNSNSTASQLGITEKVVEVTTFFYGSTLERRTNIQVAASKFHGLVIAPGEEFSFNKYLGDVSPETGYETGLVIFGDRTIQGVGGGVCQVSTTVFQAAFYAGFPITERYAHGYRVGYYESGTAYANGQKYTSGVGMDATVFSPLIDLKFVNDTPYYLLIESYYTPEKQSLTIKFYSTGTGRIVTKEGPTLSAVVAHGKPKYTESTNMKPGQTQQIDYAVDGVDAHVYRTIEQDGKVITSKEEFYSHYLPWSSQFLVAPGYAPKN